MRNLKHEKWVRYRTGDIAFPKTRMWCMNVFLCRLGVNLRIPPLLSLDLFLKSTCVVAGTEYGYPDKLS